MRKNTEVRKIVGIIENDDGTGTLILDRPLEFNHYTGERLLRIKETNGASSARLMPRKPSKKKSPEEQLVARLLMKSPTKKTKHTFTLMLTRYLENPRLAGYATKRQSGKFTGLLNGYHYFINNTAQKMPDDKFYDFFCKKHGVDQSLAEEVRKKHKEEEINQELSMLSLSKTRNGAKRPSKGHRAGLMPPVRPAAPRSSNEPTSASSVHLMPTEAYPAPTEASESAVFAP